jgi:hypothetical protein
MFGFLIQHKSCALIALYWLFSAAVSSMPEPGSNSSPGYLWLFRFCHTMAGNLTTAFGNRIPGVKSLIIVLVVPLLFVSASACVAHYTMHPGALSAADSTAYDALLIAENVIDQARTDSRSQPLGPGMKDALNAVVGSYNVARDSWLTYRGALATNTSADAYFQQLNKNLLDLANAIQALRQVKK